MAHHPVSQHGDTILYTVGDSSIANRYPRPTKVLFTLIYVLPFYFSPLTKPSPTLNRDAPTVIRARIRTVSLACLISTLSTVHLIHHSTTSITYLETLHLLGLWPLFTPFIPSLLHPLLLTALLFLGPLFEKLVVEKAYQDWFSGPNSLPNTLRTSVGFRNYIAGPVTEEILFRSLLIPLHLLANIEPTTIVFLTPLYFGIAHVHHLYEFTLTHPHTPITPALLRTLFQFAYTTLFGWYAAFVYLRTGTLVTVILIHAFCNWTGLPRLWGKVEAGEPIGPPVPVSIPPTAAAATPNDDGEGNDDRRVYGLKGGRGGRGGKRQQQHHQQQALDAIPTVAYYLLLFAGAYSFTRGLWTWTESTNALVSFGHR